MAKSRMNTLAALLKGLVLAILITIALMLALAAAAVYLDLSDTVIRWLNQLIKILSIVIGTGISVGRGGEHGFVTGMVLAIVYMVLGYAMYVLLGGNAFNAVSMLGEILIDAAAGGVAGAVFANLSSKRSRKQH